MKMIANLKLEKNISNPNQIFDAAKVIDYSAFTFQMWPGWNFKLLSSPGFHFLNVRSIHQVVRLENILEKLLLIREISLE